MLSTVKDELIFDDITEDFQSGPISIEKKPARMSKEDLESLRADAVQRRAEIFAVIRNFTAIRYPAADGSDADNEDNSEPDSDSRDHKADDWPHPSMTPTMETAVSDDNLPIVSPASGGWRSSTPHPVQSPSKSHIGSVTPKAPRPYRHSPQRSPTEERKQPKPFKPLPNSTRRHSVTKFSISKGELSVCLLLSY